MCQGVLSCAKKEATDFVTAYVAGKISAEEADEKHWRYQHRWGEALPVHVSEGISDVQVIAAIDQEAGEYSTPQRDKG